MTFIARLKIKTPNPIKPKWYKAKAEKEQKAITDVCKAATDDMKLAQKIDLYKIDKQGKEVFIKTMLI